MKVLITGSANGIGKSCCELFLATGNEVIGIDCELSTIDNTNYTHIVADIRSPLPEINDIDIIINNAGIQEGDCIGVNLIGQIKVTEKYINKNTKSVLFMTSASARNGSEFPMYVASKAGLVGYMKWLAQQVAKNGTTVNSLAAGGVTTDLNKHILENNKLRQRVMNETLLNKWASPQEIADWAYFLTCVNKSMTGEDLLIDNGEMLKSNFIW